MLTKLIIRRFKRFEEVEIELGNPVVFVGPNDSGKTSALQALTLWDVGLKRWNEKRAGESLPEKRPGVAINRRDLTAMPVPDAKLLWRNLRVRDVTRTDGKQKTHNIRVDVIVEGVSGGNEWKCGLEFDFSNEESFYCRPVRLSGGKSPDRMSIPSEAQNIRVAYLPPMSGLADREFTKQRGEIDFLIGQGRTAEVIRNLCYAILQNENGENAWNKLVEQIKQLFGVELQKPVYIAERSEITMSYRDQSGIQLDLSSSGRGLQQTLLLLAYMAVNPGSILLLDEPDAHLEILRQRQIYDILSDGARKSESQIIIASHSEVILNEAADRDVIVAFLGKPHRIDDRGSQLLKSLKEIGYQDYFQAEQVGWVLYLEGSTDLSILSTFAEMLDHPAKELLARPFVHYVMNQPQKARDHFRGLREAKPDLVGFALFDHLQDKRLREQDDLLEYMWSRREIENYFCKREVLLKWAEKGDPASAATPLLTAKAVELMEETIAEIEKAMDTLGEDSPWSPDAKVSDRFLDRVFNSFFKKLGIENLMRKKDYHVLVEYMPKDEIDSEVTDVLNGIVEVARRARPVC